jgi:CheY-like chemotaxis protein
MHFNEKREKSLFFPQKSHYLDASVNEENGPDEIDTLKIDDHSRITFTKRMKKVFSVEPEDTIKVYHDRKKNEIIFNFFRKGSIVDRLVCKRIQKDRHHVASSYETPPPYRYTMDGMQSITIQKPNSNKLNDYYNNNKTYLQKYTPNVLIVDDEEHVLIKFKLLLHQAGVNVESFSSPQEAIIHFAQVDPLHYDLIILDIKMPVISGFKLYAMMEALGAESTKFLFISALDYADEFVQLLPRIRRANFIKKPIENETLLQKIKEALDVR